MEYKVYVEREPEIIECDTFEEAEAIMKKLFKKYGERPTKYHMVKVDEPFFFARYDCDKNGNLEMVKRF